MSSFLSNDLFITSDSNFISLLPSIKNDKELILKYISKNGLLIRFLPEQYLSDTDIILKAIANDCDSITHIPINIFSNEELCFEIIKLCPVKIQYFNFNNYSSKRMIIEAIQHIGVDALWSLNSKYFHDIEIFYMALISPFGQDLWDSLEFSLGDEFSRFKDLIKESIKIHGEKVLDHDLSWLIKHK